ncbi:MAG: universal stress protein [Pirellulales bacterium]|jgi:nucleotide-binding universal stress UspA family protein
MKTQQIILHPTDFSPNSQNACQLACALAHERDARLILLHVAPQFTPRMSTSDISLLHPRHNQWKADQQLRDVDCGDLWPGRLLRYGDPATVILSTAERVKADLIVLGQPRRGKWWWLIEERVAETVMRKASCPVLIATNQKATRGKLDGERGVRSSANLRRVGSFASNGSPGLYTSGPA